MITKMTRPKNKTCKECKWFKSQSEHFGFSFIACERAKETRVLNPGFSIYNYFCGEFTPKGRKR